MRVHTCGMRRVHFARNVVEFRERPFAPLRRCYCARECAREYRGVYIHIRMYVQSVGSHRSPR